MQVVVINGKPTVGKDSFVELCQKHLLWCLNVSTVDCVKDLARWCGWDGTKDDRNRKFLSDLKDLLTNWDNVPFKKVCEAIESFEKKALLHDFPTEDVLCFVHCREPQEIQKFVDKYNAITLLIRRDSAEHAKASNHADESVLDYGYDFVVNNNSTLEKLEEMAIFFLKELGYNNLINL